MNANDTHLGAPESHGQGSRLMLVLAEGCRICVSLDSVEGVFERPPATPAGGDERAGPPGRASLRVVSWADLVGVPPPAGSGEAEHVLVVRTPAGRVALAIDACLGVRDSSFLGAPVLPTRLTDATGDSLCFVHMIDRRPHFILDPRALAHARPCTDGPAKTDGAPATESAAGGAADGATGAPS